MKNGSVHLEIEQSAPAQATHRNPPPSGALLLEEDHFIGLVGPRQVCFLQCPRCFRCIPRRGKRPGKKSQGPGGVPCLRIPEQGDPRAVSGGQTVTWQGPRVPGPPAGQLRMRGNGTSESASVAALIP